MPSIRLADIPNAGPQGVAPDSGIIAPRVAQLGGSAALDPNAMRGVAKDMQLEKYNLNAFAGEAIGMGKIGDAMSDVATLGLRFATKMADAKDDADFEKGRNILAAAAQQQENDHQNLSPEEWGSNFDKLNKGVQTDIDKLGFSKSGRAKFEAYRSNWANQTGLKITGMANKEKIEGYKMDAKIGIERELSKGNVENAFSIINTFRDNGTLSEQDAKDLERETEFKYIKIAKEERDANVASDIIKNPIGAEADLEKAIQTGKSELFPHLTERSDLVRAYSNARSEASVYRNTIEDDVDQLILSGQMTKPEDIRRVTEGVLPERRILAAIDTLSKTPAEMEKALAMRPTLLAMVDAYDRTKDDKNRSEYLKLKDSIRQLPEGERGELLSSLREKWDNAKESTPVSEATSQLKTLFTKGQFGTWTEKDGKMPDAEVPKFLAAGKKLAGFKSNLEKWAKANPKDAADQTKVYEKLNEILKADKEIQIPKSGGASWWYPSSWFAPSKPATSTDDVRKKIDAQPKSSKADSINKKSSKEDIAKAAQEIDFTTPLPEIPDFS